MDAKDENPDHRVLPHDEFAFNVLLGKISDHITDDELKKLKFYCSGRGCLCKATSENIKDPLDLFDHLKKLRLLTSENLASLQGMLWHLQRKDLCEMCIDYCRKRDGRLHFVAVSNQPPNGYQSVNFHVRGPQRLNRDSLRRLRHELSELLCCPPERIILDGILPENSIHVIFLIPQDRLKYLLNIKDREKEQLHCHGVDCFQVKDQSVRCTEFQSEEVMPSLDKDGEIRKILRTNEELVKSLERYQTDLEETRESCRSTIIDCQRELKYNKDIYSEEVSRLQMEASELQKQIQEYKLSCLLLTDSLKEIREIDDGTVIYERKDANVGKIAKLRRTLSQADNDELLEISSDIQSQIIDMLQSNEASDTTSKLMKFIKIYKNDVDQLKVHIQSLVTSNLFEDIYPLILNLKSIEDVIIQRQSAYPGSCELYEESDDDCYSD